MRDQRGMGLLRRTIIVLRLISSPRLEAAVKAPRNTPTANIELRLMSMSRLFSSPSAKALKTGDTAIRAIPVRSRTAWNPGRSASRNAAFVINTIVLKDSRICSFRVQPGTRLLDSRPCSLYYPDECRGIHSSHGRTVSPCLSQLLK